MGKTLGNRSAISSSGGLGCRLVGLVIRERFASYLCSIVECLASMKYIRAVEQLAMKAMLLVHSHRALSVFLLLIMGTRSSAG